MLQVYPFRPFTGDLKQAFGRTLFRERIDPQYREAAMAGIRPSTAVRSLVRRTSARSSAITPAGCCVPGCAWLFAATGLVYRTFEAPTLPGGDVSRFNFQDAARKDPDNAGTYRVENRRLTIQIGGGQPETVSGRVSSADALLIDAVTYSARDDL